MTLTSDHTAKNVRTLSSFPLPVYDLHPQIFLVFYHKKSWFSHAAEWDFPSLPSRPCANLNHFSKATGRYRILNKPNMHKNLTVKGAEHLKLSSGSSEWVIQDGIIHEGVIQWVIQRGSFRKGHSRGSLDGNFVVEVMCPKSNRLSHKRSNSLHFFCVFPELLVPPHVFGPNMGIY